MKKTLHILIISLSVMLAFNCSPVVDVEEEIPDITEVTDPFLIEFSYEFDALNPQETEFPGGRGTDELVVYTSESGQTTGTNHYGLEAVVKNGVIVKIQDNDNPIPEDGFVISGHEQARLWIIDNLELGMKVNFEKEEKLLHFSWDTETYRHGLELKYGQMQELRETFMDYYSLEERQLQEAIYEQIEMQIEDVAQEINRDNYEEAQKKLKYLETLIEQGFFLSAVSPSEDFRGVWDRLTATTPEEIIEFLDYLAMNGYNMVFPETYYYGRTIYPGNIVEQQSRYEGWDPLELLIEEAHKRNIEVHAWVHVAFVGFEDSPLVEQYPDWLMQTREGVKESIHENNFYYFSWGIPEAREFLKEIYREIAREYPDLDGIHFDYIRWPLQIEDHYFGFHPQTRQSFKEKSGVDPVDITPEETEKWRDFQEFKEGLITSFLKEIVQELSEINENLVFSGAVASPLKESARDLRNQNWGKWAQEGILHFLTPMIYTYDSREVYRQTREGVEKTGDKTILVSGLSTYQGQEPMNIYRQIHQARLAGSPGYVSFSWTSSSPEQRRIHRYAINRNPAEIPLKIELKNDN